jgi:cytochrome c oxidase cbb3-type subunit 3
MRKRLHGMAGLAVVLVALLTVSAASAQAGGNAERGGQLFVENCAVCHGIDGRGRAGANLNDFPGIRVDAALVQTIRQGIPGSRMPPWGQASGGPLTETDIEDLAAYILAAFSGTEPLAPLPTYQPEPVTPMAGIAGDPTAGSIVYQANCTVCHGTQGQGRVGGKLAKNWPGNEPLSYISQVVGEGIQGSTMPGWLQAQGGPLSESEVANVSAYVLALSPATGIPSPTPVPEGPVSLAGSLLLLGVVVVLAVGTMFWYYRRA